jgi:hypothetical protein
VDSTPLAPQPAEAYRAAPCKEAEELAQHIARVEARRFAWAADAEEAMTEYAGHHPGARGRRPCRWRYHGVQYRVQAEWRRTKRPRRGRPANTASLAEECGYRLVVEATALEPAGPPYGWTVRATTGRAETCADAAI